jgi:hypothetical protein
MNARDFEIRNDRLNQLCFDEYQQYLDSESWDTRKYLYELDHPKRCSFCASKEKVDLHHRSYENLGNELDEDLVWLCRDHHREYHETGQMPIKPTDKQIEILAEIGCSAAVIKSSSQREAARKIHVAQQRFLRKQRDADDDWLCTDANIQAWVERYLD